jgi:hypothetical protein
LREPPPGLPAGLVELVTTVTSGGAGPYYGLIPVEAALAHPVEGAYGRAIPIAHLGCGYAAVLPIDDQRVWLDARALGIVRPIADSALAFYLDWIDRSLRGAWPEAHVPPDACPLPNALTGYLAAWEQQHGMASGSLAGAELREALAQLGTGAIELAAGPPLFDHRDRADPCIACARLLENLGLPREIVAAGQLPIAMR